MSNKFIWLLGLFALAGVQSKGQTDKPNVLLTANSYFEEDSTVLVHISLTIRNNSSNNIYFPYEHFTDTSISNFHFRIKQGLGPRNISRLRSRSFNGGYVSSSTLKTSELKRIGPNESYNIVKSFRFSQNEFKKIVTFKVEEFYIVEPINMRGEVLQKYLNRDKIYMIPVEIQDYIDVISLDLAIDLRKRTTTISKYSSRKWKDG